MESCKTSCQTVTVRIHVNLELGNSFSKHTYPAIECLKIKHGKLSALQVLLHNESIGKRVGNGGTRCHNYAASVVLLLDKMNLVHHLLTLLGATCADTKHLICLGLNGYVLVVVSLIYKQARNAEIIEIDRIVSSFESNAQFSNLLTELLLLSLQACRELLIVLFDLLDLIFRILQLLQDEFLRKRNSIKATICHDNCIPVAITNGCECLLALIGSKVLCLHAENLSARIHSFKERFPLHDDVIRNNVQILLGKSHTLELHSGSNHHIGFTAANVMRQKRVRRKQYSCNCILLIRVKLNLIRHARKLQE